MFKRVSKRLGLIGLIGSVALLLPATPAVADTGTAAGEVVGTVTISPGVDEACRTTTYRFDGVVLTGTITAADATTPAVASYTGQIGTGPVTGHVANTPTVPALDTNPTCADNEESVHGGEGVVNPFSVSGNTTVTENGVTVTTRITGTCRGYFIRVGPVVKVFLECTIDITVTVTTPAGTTSVTTTFDGFVYVVALFVPGGGRLGTGTNGADAIQTATFAGTFTGADPPP